MIALRDLVRAQETRLWKEKGGIAGTCSFPTDLFQRQRRACDVLGEGLSCLGGSGWDVHRSIDTESGVFPVEQNLSGESAAFEHGVVRTAEGRQRDPPPARSG